MDSLELLDSIPDFYFLAYWVNPIRQRVKVYVDGDAAALYLSCDVFKQLIFSVAGFDIMPTLYETLTTHEIPWMFSKNPPTIKRIYLSQDELTSPIADFSKFKESYSATKLDSPQTQYSDAELIPYDTPKSATPNNIFIQTNTSKPETYPYIRFRRR